MNLNVPYQAVQLVMLDDILIMGPVSKNSYYFQIVPLCLSIVGKDSQLPAQGTTYRFSIHKGHHKFDENRHPILANFLFEKGVGNMEVSACRLNFYVPHYIKMRSHDFNLMLTQRERNQDFEVGVYRIDAGHFIEEYLSTKNRRFKLKTFFSQDYELDFQLYIEQTRAELEQLVKSNQEARDRKQNNEVQSRDNDEEGKRNNRSKTIDKRLNKVAINQHIVSRENSHEIRVSQNRDKLHRPNQQLQIHNQEDDFKGKEEPSNIFKTFGGEHNSQNGSSDKQDSSLIRVPLIQTKFKQLAKADTPYEIQMTESGRLSQLVKGQESSLMVDPPDRNKLIMMWTYILACLIVMYFAMHPKSNL